MIRDTYNFETLAALLAEVERPPLNKGEAASMNNDPDRTDWAGSASFPAALDMARRGWPEGLARMDKTRAAIQIPQGLESLTPSPVMADEGDEILVDRYLDGESDHFLSFPQVMTPRAGRIALVTVNIGGNNTISAETYFRRGAAALAVIDALEAAGIRCEVQICQRSHLNKTRLCQWFATIKHPEDPLELDRMAFFLASAAVQRRFSFRLRERSAAPTLWVKGSYGASHNIPDAEIPLDAIYFPTPSSNLTEEGAITMAREKVAAWTA